MSFPNQKKLPRCQCSVPSPWTMDGVDDCDEPAVALWNWGVGSMYVCEKHNEEIERQEEECESPEML